MAKNDVEKRFNSFEKRIEKLEKAVFAEKKTKKSSSGEYEGLVGGINFLIDQGYFKKLVSVDEIQNALKKDGYIYPYNSVDKILRIDFVRKKKILARDKEDSIWKYALRK